VTLLGCVFLQEHTKDHADGSTTWWTPPTTPKPTTPRDAPPRTPQVVLQYKEPAIPAGVKVSAFIIGSVLALFGLFYPATETSRSLGDTSCSVLEKIMKGGDCRYFDASELGTRIVALVIGVVLVLAAVPTDEY
jgi:hypothetical protein